MKFKIIYRIISALVLLFFNQLGHAQLINDDSDDLFYLIAPAIIVAIKVQPPSVPPPTANPENTKYPPLKVNPDGKAPPSSLPPYGSAIWPNCPNNLCPFN